jgi:hypothetical protein
MTTCPHINVSGAVCDQTLGVRCDDCDEILSVCWMDEHCSEALWNRAAARDPVNFKACEQSRHDVCFLCGETITPDAAQ